MDPGRSTEEVLQTLESLPPQVAAASPVFYTGEESYMVPNLNLEVLDLEAPQLPSPQECMEDRPPVPGWPYSPLSPSMELNTSLS